MSIRQTILALDREKKLREAAKAKAKKKVAHQAKKKAMHKKGQDAGKKADSGKRTYIQKRMDSIKAADEINAHLSKARRKLKIKKQKKIK